jgi:hypothetical protein
MPALAEYTITSPKPEQQDGPEEHLVEGELLGHR